MASTSKKRGVNNPMQYLYITLSAIILLTILFLIAMHLGFRAPRIRETGTPKDIGIDFVTLSIPTASNKRLFGWFLPAENSTEVILILHGWGGNAELMLPLALPFHKAGLNVVLLDSRCHGNSDSAFFASLPRFAEDLSYTIDWFKQNYPKQSDKIALLGHSVGAGAVLFAASRRNDINAVISVSAFAHPEWMMKRYLKNFKVPQLLTSLILKYTEFIIQHSFTTIAPLNTVCHIHSPILLVHGKEDVIVPISDAQSIIKNCPQPHIELLEIEDAGHESVDKIEQHGDALVLFLQKAVFFVLISP
jgi:pimeloyl-ACP methyl ester carboxylesterase